jgi:hypothetical protein
VLTGLICEVGTVELFDGGRLTIAAQAPTRDKLGQQLHHQHLRFDDPEGE